MSFVDEYEISPEDHDASRARLVPCLEVLHETVRQLLPAPRAGEPYRLLDLGAGSGQLAETILDIHNGAEITLVDGSEAMLAAAKDRLARFGERAIFKRGDYAGMSFDGPYDAIFSELSIHHLDHRSKRTVFSQAFAALRRGGRFINADQVRGQSEGAEQLYVETWLAMVKTAGATEDDLAGPRASRSRDRLATIPDMIDWMQGDGFENVDCYYKHWCFAVLAGDKV